ncbi:hypothetical protein EWM64_g117 [Hericium alpestre]|uniref:Uncharacterized protein n=1 Tax=Hericium alpestre TaxID=135208 RepID=A0A4Z0AC53_9AGAM|nr:hypothetical protein EWM64_g117 [Hericium alpestre]
MADPKQLASKFDAIAPQLADGGVDAWQEAELAAQKLANALRVKNPEDDVHTALGETQLPQTLTTILKASVKESRVADAAPLAAVYEALRVGANLCMDHDANRGHLLDAKFPQTVVSILEGYAELIGQFPDILPLSIPQLKVIKTCIGLLLNASVGYEPVKFRLISLEAAVTILRLTSAIYPAGYWMKGASDVFTPEQNANPSPEDINESWMLRSGLSNWAWRTIAELNEFKDESRTLFTPEVLPLLIPPLRVYMPPVSTPTGHFEQPTALRRTLVAADFEVFEETCSLLESMTFDVEDVRLSLARGMPFPGEHDGVPCLAEILRFIDEGDYHPLWSGSTDSVASERGRREKSFDLCKAALIKCVVEVAGEDKNVDVLWDESDPAHPGGAFVSQMVKWIKSQKNLRQHNRDDLIICATLSLGNMVRHESHSIIVVNPPIELGPHLAALLSPEADLKVKHGVIGLLRHLAYAAPTRGPLGRAGIIQRLVASGIFTDTSPMAEMVQLSAIGIAKHLSNGDAENCFSLVLPAEGQDPASSGVQQILDLVQRSDMTAVKSEGDAGKRAAHEGEGGDCHSRRRVCACSAYWPLEEVPGVINEGMVALTLLTLQGSGGNVALDAITSPLPKEAQQGPALAVESNDVSSPVVTPGRALDMLITVLKNQPNRFQEEIRVNVCTLLGHIGREGAVTADRATELEKVKTETKPLLDVVAGAEQESRLKAAAVKALQLWS